MGSQYYYDTSLWDYKPGEFRQLINTITPKSVLVSEALANFRELPVMPHRLRNMTIQEVSTNPDLVLELLNTRNGMEPESKFNRGCKPKEREQQLIDELAATYKIDTEKVRAKVVLGRFDNRPNQYFTYAIEFVIGPITDPGVDYAGRVHIIDSINDDASSDGGGAYFADGHYLWTDKKRYDRMGDRKEGNALSAHSIREILSECGFSSGNPLSRRKKPCIVFMNLKCRVIEWLGSKGKTQINTKPFADDIANIVSSLAYKMPSYYGQGFAASDTSSLEPKEEKQTAIDYLRDWLWERRKKVEADPSLKTRDRLTQSEVYYRVRRIMIEGGFEPPKDWGTTRSTLQNSIMKTCQELWPNENITREHNLGLGSYLQDPYVSIQNIYAPVDLVSDITLAASVRGQCIVHIVFHLTQAIKIYADVYLL